MMMEMLMKTLAALISQRDHVARDCNCVCAESVFMLARRTPNVSDVLEQNMLPRSRAPAAVRARSISPGRDERWRTPWREKELINRHGYTDYWNLF